MQWKDDKWGDKQDPLASPSSFTPSFLFRLSENGRPGVKMLCRGLTSEVFRYQETKAKP